MLGYANWNATKRVQLGDQRSHCPRFDIVFFAIRTQAIGKGIKQGVQMMLGSITRGRRLKS